MISPECVFIIYIIILIKVNVLIKQKHTNKTKFCKIARRTNQIQEALNLGKASINIRGKQLRWVIGQDEKP
ncbi:unnamed protein product [Paramecium octaurelia]|uniref:Uncharacterized protein n=1 Tax=Paramecium octaurelia TaxID=43137 RepID=A0A8S1V6E7_PAROT|nr:unnamed protein product [Paramecium octaurelia]